MRSRLRSFSTGYKMFSFWNTPRVAPPWLVRLGNVSPQISPDQFPKDVMLPDYAFSGEVDPASLPKLPPVWNQAEVEGIRRACKLARKILNSTGDLVQKGVTTDSIDKQVHQMIVSNRAYPSTLNFNRFPKSVSISIGNVAAHGVPDDRPLEDGDVVNIDISVYLDGFHGDCSETFLVGDCDSTARHLVNAARECLFQGIGACGPGEPIRKIGHTIHSFAKRRRVNPIPNLCGHGIGTFFHGPPDLYHVMNNYPGLQQPGMVFTIEPCISEGSKAVRILDDGFTVVTLDGSRTAQFEHTVLITEVGVEILTA